jgi:hypothetical protein
MINNYYYLLDLLNYDQKWLKNNKYYMIFCFIGFYNKKIDFNNSNYEFILLNSPLVNRDLKYEGNQKLTE